MKHQNYEFPSIPRFYTEDKEAVSGFVSGGNPSYAFEKKFTYKPINKQLVAYLSDSALYIEVSF